MLTGHHRLGQRLSYGNDREQGTGMVTPFHQQCEALLMHLEETERADKRSKDMAQRNAVSRVRS
jgi:hypothetical protein